MAFCNRLWTQFGSSTDVKQLHKQADALKIGILGAANICNMALLSPASRLSNVVVYGIAARDRQRAEVFARKHHIPKVYDNYEQLIADPEISIVYNPLPNALHHQWTIQALRAGKHVLCEKPLANNADEARQMVDEAKKQNRLLVEAFHYRYHPLCNETLREILSKKDELGAVQSVASSFSIPSLFLKNNDIRYQYPLGGGSLMDAGCYLISMCRFVVNTLKNRTENDEGSFEVQKAEALGVTPANPQIDYGTRADLVLDGVQCHLHCEFTNRWLHFEQRIVIEFERATITIAFLIAPVFYHYITIRQRENGQTRTVKDYADNQSTYYYQLKAFTDAVHLVQEGTSLDQAYRIAFTTGENGIRNMEIIDEIYRKAGLSVRGASI